MKPVRHTVAALASACLFTACGGGGSEDPTPTTAATSQATRTASAVQLEGCVVDQNDQPRATRVHAFSEDGRLIATATSSPQGVYQLSVPALAHVSVGLDAAGGESLALLTGSTNLSVGACLRDSAA